MPKTPISLSSFCNFHPEEGPYLTKIDKLYKVSTLPLVECVFGAVGNVQKLYLFVGSRARKRFAEADNRLPLTKLGKGWWRVVHGDGEELSITLMKQQLSEICLAQSRGIRQHGLKYGIEFVR